MINLGMMRLLLPLIALTLAAPATAKTGGGLTVAIGESWMFRIERGQPGHARKVTPTTRPRPGEIRLTLRSMIGTTMTVISNSPRSYTYRATLIGVGGKEIAAKSCALPADSRFAFESWPQSASAVRVSDFKVTRDDAACP